MLYYSLWQALLGCFPIDIIPSHNISNIKVLVILSLKKIRKVKKLPYYLYSVLYQPF